MAQLSIREYLTSECKKENIVLRFHLAMVKKAHLDIQENLSESEESECQCNSTEAGCVVDGILQQETRGSFKKDKECQVLIQSLHQTTICPENIKPIRRRGCLSSSTSDDITIYYYKSNMLEDLEKGVPVVLNISNSNQFLKCTFRSDKAVLTVECWEKDKLDSIYKNDPTTWPFVFYLTCTKDNCRRFESAECSGWFIHTESNYVCMAEQKDKDKDSEKYSFLILRSPNTTKSK
ncbi:hypothetical protein PHYPO_G00147770 [Pangasianodon hypophthalmus]|uniref:Interleukin-1 n=1 Tax=Pangasianodon hypophthalmus TaxID=310915 RepID=A0A5N5K968_PANHP|nr:uncharacterized protein LOC113547442 [Pangasianodon hypophthalmus]KAB5526095.1 hypothetical protein PHYPO_G00147770 [Pangasianodon hypophthalmus]